jgi:hypothetical protein
MVRFPGCCFRGLSAGLCLLLGVAGLMVLVQPPAQAGSTVVDGPGFHLEKRRGWFGRERHVYRDAFGNSIEDRTGFFGRKTTRAGLFGTQVEQNNRRLSVVDRDGKPLVSRRKTWFNGEDTYVDGNQIFHNVKELLKP